MREIIKNIIVNSRNYIFNGNNMELFFVNNMEEAENYIKGMDNVVQNNDEQYSMRKIVLNISNMCNLKCVYCYAEGGDYGRENYLMTKDALDKIIIDIHYRNIREIGVLSFFGGEPLLNFNLIKYGLDKFSNEFNVKNFEVVTNGILINEKNLEVLKKYNVKLAISIDGPRDVTDELRGKGTYDLAMNAILLAKKIEYPRLEASATYTKIHEKFGYSRNDILNFFVNLGVKPTISKVLTSNDNLKCLMSISKQQMRSDIQDSLEAILLNNNKIHLNMYLYNVLLSLIYKAKTCGYCDDLSAKYSITYDYNGDKYNCFRLWGDDKYKIIGENDNNNIIRKINNKSNNIYCKRCWAKNFCKICVVAIEQGADNFEIKPLCGEALTYEMCLEEIIKVIQNDNLNALISNFINNFLEYK